MGMLGEQLLGGQQGLEPAATRVTSSRLRTHSSIPRGRTRMPTDPHDSDREKSRGTRRASQKWRTQYRAPPSSALGGRDQAVLRSVLQTEGMHQALDHPVYRGRLEKTRAVAERGAEIRAQGGSA